MESNNKTDLHIDHIETVNDDHAHVVGSTKLITDSELVLVPTPTNDPNGKFWKF
jgi:hypothetical protein